MKLPHLFKKYVDEKLNVSREILTYRIIIVTLLVLIIILSLAITNLSDANNRSYRIFIPPNLDNGAILNTEEVSKFEVWKFATYIEQQLYYWESNGADDFKDNIEQLSIFITPEYKKFLLEKYTDLLSRGELTGRAKGLHPANLFNAELVETTNDGWIVSADFHAREYFKGEKFKDKFQRHFIKVIYRSINPEINPWPFQLDVPVSNIKELKKSEGR